MESLCVEAGGGGGGGVLTDLSWVTTESQLSARLQVESGLTGVAVAAGNTHTGGLSQRKLADLH